MKRPGLWEGLAVVVIATTPLLIQALPEYDLTVANAELGPDGFQRPVLTVNDQIPGPTVRVQKGESVRITVHNNMSTGDQLEMHYHGITQRGTPWMDGTHDTQCPIVSGEAFVYDFSVGDQVGTYMYHAHSGPAHSTDGVFGALIVEDPDVPFHYDEDRILMLADWWHITGGQQAQGVLNKDFKWVGDPESLLINGKGNFTCTTTKKWGSCQGLEVIQVEPDKTYYLRLIGVQSLDMIDFAIEGYNLTVVESDGNYVEPFETSHVLINSGERYGVLLHTKADHPSESWIMMETRYRKLVAGYGVMSMSPTLPKAPAHEPPLHPGRWSARAMEMEEQWKALEARNGSAAVVGPIKDEVYRLQGLEGMAWVKQVKSLASTRASNPLVDANRFIKYVGTQCKTSDDGLFTYFAPYRQPLGNLEPRGYLRWCVNGVSDATLEPVRAEGEPLLFQAYNNQIPPDHPSYLQLNKGDVVEIVLENGWALNRVNEQHPWHLHGHSFHVLGYGEGQWDDTNSWKKLNYVDPPVKDTVTVYPFGWAVIRFVADNPGVHMLHCHLKTHQMMGMGGTIIERASEIPPPPSGFPTCTMDHSHHHMDHEHRSLRSHLPTDQDREHLSYYALAISLAVAIVLVALAYFFCRGFACCQRETDGGLSKKEEEADKSKTNTLRGESKETLALPVVLNTTSASRNTTNKL